MTTTINPSIIVGSTETMSDYDKTYPLTGYRNVAQLKYDIIQHMKGSPAADTEIQEHEYTCPNCNQSIFHDIESCDPPLCPVCDIMLQHENRKSNEVITSLVDMSWFYDLEDFGDLEIPDHVEDNYLTFLIDLAKQMEQVGDNGLALACYAENQGWCEWDHINTTQFKDHFRGEYESEESYCVELVKDIEDPSDFLEGYIDYEKMARDLFSTDYESITTDDGMVLVFRK